LSIGSFSAFSPNPACFFAANTWLSNNNNIQCLFDGATKAEKKGTAHEQKVKGTPNKKQHCQMSLAFADVARYLLTPPRNTHTPSRSHTHTTISFPFALVLTTFPELCLLFRFSVASGPKCKLTFLCLRFGLLSYRQKNYGIMIDLFYILARTQCIQKKNAGST